MTEPEDDVALLPPPYRRKRTAARVVSERAHAAGVPFSAMIEVADRCNEACVHCYQVQGEKGELGTEEWERVLGELAELGVLFLTISGGEPTLRKDFLQLVAYARSLRFAVKIFSNGLNITPSMAAELGRLAVQEVQISLYSTRAEVHDGVTRVPGSFERVVEATRALRSAGVKVVLKSPLMTLNASEYVEYVDFVTALGADYTLDPKLNPRENGDVSPTSLAIDKATFLALNRDLRFAAPEQPGPRRQSSTPCSACRGSLHVEPNGELRPCTQWNIATGHVADGPLRDTWYDNAAANAIRGLTWDDLPGCRVCDLRSHCQRCFADAERYTGSALAPYAGACQGALWKYEVASGVEPALVFDAAAPLGAPPVGPFRAIGEHRFSAQRVAKGAAPARRDAWLPAEAAAAPRASAQGIVSLRRHLTGPALTPQRPTPSERGG